jgi:GNAT superfamily N-acetyltransferase
VADGGVSLRFATFADAEALSAFSVATYVAAFGVHFRPDDLTAYLDAELSVARWRDYLAHDRVLVAEAGGATAGYVHFGPTDEGEGVEIHRLYVAPDNLGRGLGTRPLTAALDQPEVSAAQAVWIDVWEEMPVREGSTSGSGSSPPAGRSHS